MAQTVKLNEGQPGETTVIIPEEGEIFRAGGEGTVFKRVGNKIISLDLQSAFITDIGSAEFRGEANVSSTAGYTQGDVWNVAKKRASAAGMFNFDKLPSYNLGDIFSTEEFERASAQSLTSSSQDVVAFRVAEGMTGGVTGGGGMPAFGEGGKEARAFHEFDAYKNLSEDDKLFIDEMFGLIQFGGEQEAKIFANAVEQAKGIADPFFKAKLGLALAETAGKIAEVTGNFEVQKEILERAREELLENAKIGREFFSLEQQSDIARLASGYQEDILRISDLAAEKGLVFATGARSRQLAEARRAEQYTDVVQSTTRTHNLRMKELELRASRGDTAAQRQLEALRSQQKFQLQSIGRGAEELLGTEALGDVSGLGGYEPVGGVMGTIEEQKRKSLISDVGAFIELQRGFV